PHRASRHVLGRCGADHRRPPPASLVARHARRRRLLRAPSARHSSHVRQQRAARAAPRRSADRRVRALQDDRRGVERGIGCADRDACGHNERARDRKWWPARRHAVRCRPNHAEVGHLHRRRRVVFDAERGGGTRARHADRRRRPASHRRRGARARHRRVVRRSLRDRNARCARNRRLSGGQIRVDVDVHRRTDWPMSSTGDPMRGTDPALALSHVTKRFGGTLALDDVSFALARGTVHSLLGENGAGKTTLTNIAFGLTRADAATMLVAGEPCRVSSPAEAIRAGIGMVHQHFTNVGAMTVAENVALGGRGGYDAGRAAATVAAVGARAGLSLDPLARADSLPVGAQQRLEIVKALARGARILILDEPTAVLAPAESEELLRWLRTFADEGNSVVLITHKLRDALSVADEVTVLRRGRVVHTGRAAGLSAERLATMLVGQSERDPRMATELGGPLPSERAYERAASVGDVIASMSHIGLADERGITSVRDLTFEVRAGEL